MPPPARMTRSRYDLALRSLFPAAAACLFDAGQITSLTTLAQGAGSKLAARFGMDWRFAFYGVAAVIIAASMVAVIDLARYLAG